jgi:hypothetical protein
MHWDNSVFTLLKLSTSQSFCTSEKQFLQGSEQSIARAEMQLRQVI